MDDAKDRRSCRPRKQSVWFVRYGLTEHPLVEDLGPYDSDIDPTEGVDHAVSIAKRVAAGVDGGDDDDDDDGSVPGVVYASPFLRTTRTGYIIANELEERRRKRRPSTATAGVELRIEEGLWEWLIPSLLVTKSDGIRTHPRLPEELRGLLEGSGGDDDDDDPRAATSAAAVVVATGYESVNPYDDSGDDGTIRAPPRPASLPAARGAAGAPRWTETEDRLLERCATTLSGLLKAHETDGGSFCVVSHAPCDQAMAFFLEKEASSGAVATPSDSTLAPWPLGGITVFSRPIVCDDDGDDGDGDDEKKIAGFGSWTMELYGDTDHMPGAYKAGLKEWSLPCFSSSG